MQHQLQLPAPAAGAHLQLPQLVPAAQQLGAGGGRAGVLLAAELYELLWLLYTCCLWCGGAGGGRVPGLSPAHSHSWVIDWAGTGALPGTAQREHRQSGTWNCVQTLPGGTRAVFISKKSISYNLLYKLSLHCT